MQNIPHQIVYDFYANYVSILTKYEKEITQKEIERVVGLGMNCM
ncbi:Protein of unknown function [Bacillus cereus]|nr:Protein of unknown function [Bacillus cereus]